MIKSNFTNPPIKYFHGYSSETYEMYIYTQYQCLYFILKYLTFFLGYLFWRTINLNRYFSQIQHLIIHISKNTNILLIISDKHEKFYINGSYFNNELIEITKK